MDLSIVGAPGDPSKAPAYLLIAGIGVALVFMIWVALVAQKNARSRLGVKKGERYHLLAGFNYLGGNPKCEIPTGGVSIVFTEQLFAVQTIGCQDTTNRSTIGPYWYRDRDRGGNSPTDHGNPTGVDWDPRVCLEEENRRLRHGDDRHQQRTIRVRDAKEN